MTPKEFKEARLKLGLTLAQMGRMLGYSGAQLKATAFRLENGERPIREAQRRLIEAYLAGYRPPDWPGRAVAEENEMPESCD